MLSGLAIDDDVSFKTPKVKIIIIIMKGLAERMTLLFMSLRLTLKFMIMAVEISIQLTKSGKEHPT